MQEGRKLCLSGLRQTEADSDGIIYTVHHTLIQTAHVLTQSALVDGPYLLQKHDGILGQADIFPRQLNVGGELCLVGLTGDGRRDHGGRVLVSGVILDDEIGRASCRERV